MQGLAIVNGTVLTPHRAIENAGVRIENGIITEVGKAISTEGCRVVDAAGLTIAPGFVDIHLHGGGGHDFMDGTADAFLGASRAHAAHGTTTLLPTTLTCADEELEGVFKAFLAARADSGEGAGMPGLHLEGPYFAHEQRGAQDPRYLRNPDPAHYGAILARWGRQILRWSAAPELPGALALGRALRDRGILPCAAHTDAYSEQVEEAFENGYGHMTHLYSAMSGLRRVDGMRRAGAVESAYLLDEITVEVIADGVHLPPALLKQVYSGIGPARTALVTDAMRAAGQEVSRSLLGSLANGLPVIVEDGVAKLPDRSAFAGSVATMDRLVRTMVRQAGVPLIDAVRMATSTPARIVALGQKGRLAPGMDGDVVVFDQAIAIKLVIAGGRRLSGDL